MSADRDEIRNGILALIEQMESLRVPIAWFGAFRSPTAALLLADILESYITPKSRYKNSSYFEGPELLLEFKKLAAKFALSERSISRAIRLLSQKKAILCTREDRVIAGKRRRNIVGVIPDVAAIARLSGADLGDILSAPELTDNQISLMKIWNEEFREIFGSVYRVTARQRLADVAAMAQLDIPSGKRSAANSSRRYFVWLQQFLAALKTKAEREHGHIRQAVFDRNGMVMPQFTLEGFVTWAKTDDSLPDGFSRRRF